MSNIINRPNALYYNGELIGIITNADPYGRIEDIVEALSPDSGLCEVRSMHVTSDLVATLKPLPEVIPVDYGISINNEECVEDDLHLSNCDDDGFCNYCGEQ